MFHYMMMPWERHSDGGLGATGEAFEEAADQLLDSTVRTKVINVHLPAGFLYRHAIELFLKSMIVVLHRSLSLPYGTIPASGAPHVLSGGQWVRLDTIHSVLKLWSYYRKIVGEQAEQLNAKCRTDWVSIPEALERRIHEIDTADTTSTYFRYPELKRARSEEKKSSWQNADPGKLSEKLKKSAGPPVKAFMILGPSDEILDAFEYDDSTLNDLIDKLAETAHELSGCHSGLRVELAGGF